MSGLRSMTGFGTGHAAVGDAGRVTVELRAVNHRYLDLRLKMPSELSTHGAAMEELVRKRMTRGRVELTVRLEGATAPVPRLDRTRARAVLTQLRELRDELAPEEPIPMSVLAAVPDLFDTASVDDPKRLATPLLEATALAADAVEAMRAEEGRALHADMSARLRALEAGIDAVESRVPSVVAGNRERLRERIEKLLEGVAVKADESRLELEIAIAADKADVAEELTRLRSHVAQFEKCLDAPGEAAGRRLDFLLQEMNRETNTIGSKSSDADVTGNVIEIKAELERLREQVQNVV